MGKEETNIITMESLILEIIKARGKTYKEVADDIGIHYKTFHGILHRPNTMKADLLFKLSDYLGFDLEWMKNSLGYAESKDVFSVAIPRMPRELRESQRKGVLANIDDFIKEDPENLTGIADRVYKLYFMNDFYILDVLLPEDDEIVEEAVNRGKTIYCCVMKPIINRAPGRVSLRPQVYTAKELIKRIISERM